MPIDVLVTFSAIMPAIVPMIIQAIQFIPVGSG